MMVAALGVVARHGRWCLVLGLLFGLAFPALAAFLRPWLPHMIAALLFVSALRINPLVAMGGVSSISQTLRIVAVYQLFLPLSALALVWSLGVISTPWALALVLVLAAPPVTGSPNFTILLGEDPAIAMRLLLVGTAAFPLTALPVLFLSPAVATFGGVLVGAAKLIAVIVGVVGLAFAIRTLFWKIIRDVEEVALDGLSALLLGVVVVALMSAIGPALRSSPGEVAYWLAFATGINFGAQVLARNYLPVHINEGDRPGAALVAGNRNIALFLVALPEHTTDAILLFTGCYQIPMYLTPFLMKRVLAINPR
jgi:arsenite transporter